MTKREPTAHDLRISGEPESIPEYNPVKIWFAQLQYWFSRWLIFSVLLWLFLYFARNMSPYSAFFLVSIMNFGLAVATFGATIYSANIAVQSPIMYVGGTGAVADMRDAKKRAEGFSFPFAIFLHGLIFLLIALFVA